MPLDSKNLGRLKRVADPRDVWASESGDFTPWLAENIDVLADELGMSLSVVRTEVPVGSFRLDIQARDEDDRVVVIENQLERTDHGHLGQCLLYAAGMDASVVVWIAPSFREESRQALDWLNERTDLSIHFFGVEISVVRIDDSGPSAPVFTVVARPNDWQKAVRGTATNAPVAVSDLNARRQDFFADVLADVTAAKPAIRVPNRSRANWLAFATGPFGYWAISVAQPGNRLRLEAYLDLQDQTLTKVLFDELAEDKRAIEASVGEQLSWERLDDKRASRLCVYVPFDIDDEAGRDAVRLRAVTVLLGLYDALNVRLRERAASLRTTATAPVASPVGAPGDDAPDGSRVD